MAEAGAIADSDVPIAAEEELLSSAGEGDEDTDADSPSFDTFASFADLQAKVDEYQRVNFVQFWKREARTIEAARKRIDKYLKPELKYYELKYCCIHGGQAFKGKSKGSRSTSTFKQDCTAHISLRACLDGLSLVIKSISLEHNHDISRELYRHLPGQRKLSTELKEKAEGLLGLKANKKLIQQQLSVESDSIILLKDLSNISTCAKRKKTRNDLESTVKTLTDKYGASVEIYSDKEKNFKGIFFQDHHMKETFHAYPEFLCLDATYKLLQLGIPVYLMLCEDSNGQSEIIAVCLLVCEDSDSMKWMLDAFKKQNAHWTKVRVVMADKDIREREVIKQCLPNTSVLICLFHTMRSFKREVTCEKMGITSGQRTLCLELLQKLAYAASADDYDHVCNQFERDAPKTVIEYFRENWHPIRSEWVMAFKSSCGNFLNSTNNRLESINGKLKQVIDRNSSLEDFIDNFFVILSALRTERDHKAALMFQKVKVYPFAADTSEGKYSKLLTSYASPLVVNQLKLAGKVKQINEVNGEYFVDTSEGKKTVTSNDCTCMFRKSMLLPCRHIFAFRGKFGHDLYDPNLCDERWTTLYYRSTQRLFSSSRPTPELMIRECSSSKHRKLSQHEKFRKAAVLTSELASVISVSSNVHFQRRIKLVKDLIDYWKRSEEVGLVEVDKDSEEVEDSSDSDECSSQTSELESTQENVTGELNLTVVSSCPGSSKDDVDGSTTQTCSATDPLSNVRGLKVPPAVKKRGRPRGCELTTIGLPKKRAKNKLSAFARLHSSDKVKVILSWFVDKQVISKALQTGTLIEEEDIESKPEKVPHSVLDENVDLCLVRPYFSSDAWLLLEEVVSTKAQTIVWTCTSCHHDLQQESIACDSCLCWYDFRCVGLKGRPKAKYWFCRSCHSKCT